jgi:menaquinone-dependent protoporphyrinogen oxidase
LHRLYPVSFVVVREQRAERAPLARQREWFSRAAGRSLATTPPRLPVQTGTLDARREGMRKRTKCEIPTGAIAVLYATREGQTAKIATRFAADLRAHDCAVVLYNLRDADVALGGASAVVLAASVHLHHHEKEMVTFARDHREQLARLPTLFMSVSLSEAGAEMATRPASVRAQASTEVHAVADQFFAATGFRPTHFLPVAGALAYRHYNFLVRFIMKRIAAAEGASTDTSREHEYTDWSLIDATAKSFAQEVCDRPARGVPLTAPPAPPSFGRAP